MRQFLSLLFLLSALAGWPVRADAGERPNVVLFLVDDLGWKDIGCQGSEHGTPGGYFFPYKGKWTVPTTGKPVIKQTLPDGKAGEYLTDRLTDRLTDEAIAQIREHKARPFFLYYPHYNQHPQSAPTAVIRRGSWKLIEFLETGSVELFDLSKDLGETTALSKQEAQRTSKLRGDLHAWQKQVGAEPMLPNPQFEGEQ